MSATSSMVTFDTIKLDAFVELVAVDGQLRVVYRVPATGRVLCSHRADVEAKQLIVHRGDAVQYGYLGIEVTTPEGKGRLHLHHVHGVKEVGVVTIGGVAVPVQARHDYRPSDDELVQVSREKAAEQAERERALNAQQLEKLGAWLRTKQPTWFTAVRVRDVVTAGALRYAPNIGHLTTREGGLRLLRMFLSPSGMDIDLSARHCHLRPDVERIYFEAFEAAKQRKAAAKAAWLARKGGE